MGDWRYNYTFLTPTIDEEEWSASGSVQLTPGEGTHGAHWIGGWVDAWVGLHAVEKITLPTPAGNRTRIPRFSIL
jgi:hypothetical protein